MPHLKFLNIPLRGLRISMSAYTLGDCCSGNRDFTDVHFASCKYLSFNSSVPKPTWFCFQQNQQEAQWMIKLERTTITMCFSSVVPENPNRVQSVIPLKRKRLPSLCPRLTQASLINRWAFSLSTQYKYTLLAHANINLISSYCIDQVTANVLICYILFPRVMF